MKDGSDKTSLPIILCKTNEGCKSSTPVVGVYGNVCGKLTDTATQKKQLMIN